MKSQYELIIVGGGFAGVAAAISAAKEGVDVLLVEKYNCLGGAAANALCNWRCRALHAGRLRV